MNNRSVLSTVVLAVALMLSVGYLAKLQWGWMRSIENSEHVRVRNVVSKTAWMLKIVFDDEIESLERCFQPPGGGRTQLAAQLHSRLEVWRQTSRWPRLLQDIYLISGDEGGAVVVELFDSAARRFDPLAWPAALGPLREETAALLADDAPDLTPRRGATRRVVASVPALLIQTRLQAEPGAGLEEAWLAMRLDKEYLRTEFLPALISLFFSPPNFETIDIAVAETASGDLLFSTLPIDSLADFGRKDVAYGLVDAGTDGEELPRIADMRAPRGQEARANWHNPPTAADHTWFRNLYARHFHSGYWQLFVRRAGVSFADEVAANRMRTLRTSFGLLALLSIATSVLVVLARRAQRLARQQMNFVAGVSHELRTPLAVLSAAGDNLADSLVMDSEQMTKYGRVIQKETQRLHEMVENVLHVARRNSPVPQAELRPLDIARLVEETLRRSDRQLEKAGFEVEKEIQPGSLRVLGNAKALQSAILNLISNAIKYGRSARWLRISVFTAGPQGHEEVRVQVEDRGPGVEEEDLPRLFEAFFRGKRAREAQIEGSGLGLTVVADVAKAHKGRVSIQSRSPRGSSFILHLPLLRSAR